MRIGLFGGSFNPPHAGHLLVSQTALKRLRLDRLWWLVTPGNPLKDHGDLLELDQRIALAQSLAQDPRIKVTGLEAFIGTRYTHDTISYLMRRCPGVHFIWVMGADNLAQFHRWQRWRDIAAMIPIAIVDRPGATLRATRAKAALALEGRRLPERDAGLLALTAPPALVFLHGKRLALSSTDLRLAAATASDMTASL